jgi:flagellar basal-body rod protein FlgF
VNPPAESVERGADGLFRARGNTPVEANASVQLSSGSLESSNVNIAEAMVTMIELARHFEMQVKMMRTAEENAASSAQLLRMS